MDVSARKVCLKMGLYDTDRNHDNYLTDPFTSLHSPLLDQSSSLCETMATREPQESTEHRIFQQHYNRLVEYIQNPLYLVILLYSRGIITSKVRDYTSMATLTTLEKSNALLSAIEKQIHHDPQIFHEFMSALKEVPYLSPMVDSMQSKFFMCLHKIPAWIILKKKDSDLMTT